MSMNKLLTGSEGHQRQDLNDHCSCAGNASAGRRFESSKKIKVDITGDASPGDTK